MVLNVKEARLGNQLMRGRPLSDAEEKARTLVAKMEKRLGKLVRRDAKASPRGKKRQRRSMA